LGIESFQVLQFVTTPFQIGLQAKLVPRTIEAETQSILRIGQSEADLEMRIKVSVGKRPIYKLSFDLPKEVEIRSLAAGLNESWTSETIDDLQRIQFFFPSGIANDFAILLDAELAAYSGEKEWSIPNIKLNDVQRQTGFIAVQVDPALSVSTSNLKNCETVLLRQVESWLNRDQRSSTQVALRTKGHDYAATLSFTKIEPRVTVETVTNVRTTLFAIEETILLDFDIQQAGIRQIQFELPAAMREARINAKLVSETIVDDVAENPEVVRVTLNLQDEVIDSFRVVIENDRQLSGSIQNVPVPRVLTGITEQRFATLQNAGRDEINVLPGAGFQVLNRQLKQFAQLKQKLSGGEVTMAYVAANESEKPILQYETKQRDVFDTVAASIEFSKTTMVVDSSGAYRALQKFQVNNRSEQYLEIELPTGARLLTVLVEGQPVKPVAWPAAANERRLRIPLVKTQLGDLDYPVELKYSGQLGQLANFNEVEFPVIETLNINVQLSQLHLRLPDSHRWMNFGGTMTKVDDRGKLEESYLSYKSRQIQQLAEQIQSKSSSFSSFSRKRAYGNLKKLQRDMDEYDSSGSEWESANEDIDPRGDQQMKILIGMNNDAIKQAEQSYREQSSESAQVQIDNRANFNILIEGQDAKISRNSINKIDQNFQSDSWEIQKALRRKDKLAAGRQAGANEGFDSKWLERNKLQGQLPQEQAKSSKNGLVPYAENLSLVVAAPDDVQIDDSIGYSNSVEGLRNQAGENDAPFGDYGEGGRGSDEIAGEGNEDGDENPFGDYGGGGGGFGGAAGDSNEDGDRGSETGALRSANLRPTDGRENVDRTESVLGSSLSSLEIELPARGTDFYFKSPRGKATVIVRPLESRSFSRWLSVAITLGVCLGVGLACWFLIWLSQKPGLRLLATIGLLFGGLFSLVASLFPVYGLIALVASIVLLVVWSINSFVQDPPTAVSRR